MALQSKCFSDSSFVVFIALSSFFNVLRIKVDQTLLFALLFTVPSIYSDQSRQIISLHWISGCPCGPLFIYLGFVGLDHQLSWEKWGRELRAGQSHQENWLVYFIFFVFIESIARKTSFLHKVFYLDELPYVDTTWLCLLSASWRWVALSLCFWKYYLNLEW